MDVVLLLIVVAVIAYVGWKRGWFNELRDDLDLK